MRSTSTYNNPKPCNYNCETRIYWNNQENEYFEVLSGNRHQCTNRKQQQQQSNYNNKKATYSSSQQTTSIANKPSYYSTNNKPIIPIINLNQKCLILLNYCKVL